jgi:hypothetical protein
MNRVIRPGVWLVFLFTGMSATALACAVKAERDGGGHAVVAINRTAALFCYAAIVGPGVYTETTSSASVLNHLAIEAHEPFFAALDSPAVHSLGAAKMSHFGHLSARKE